MSTESPTAQLLWLEVSELRDELEQLDRQILALAAANLALCIAVAVLVWRMLWVAR